MSTIPKTLELCAGGTQFYLRDEFGGYIARTCGSEDWAEAQATEICLRYNQHERLKLELNAANAEIERLENITASGIHTCSEQCQRPMCVMRRQLRDANAKIAELEAQLERDRWAIAPAMAQARINTLAAENQGQRDAITELRKELELLKAKSQQRRGPYGKLEDFDPFDPV